MIVTRNYKFRIYPTKKQEHIIRDVYEPILKSQINYANSKRIIRSKLIPVHCEPTTRIDKCVLVGVGGKKHTKSVVRWNGEWTMKRVRVTRPDGKPIGYLDHQRDLTIAREKYEWMRAVPCSVSQRALRALDASWSAFFKMPERGRPKFKNERSNVLVSCTASNKFIGDDYIRFAEPQGREGLGKIKAVIHRPVPGVVKAITITRESDKRWYAVVSADVEVGQPQDRHLMAVGIDRGVIHMVADSDGRLHAIPQSIAELSAKADELKSLNDIRRKNDNSRAQSKNWAKGNDRVARVRARVARIRHNFVHNLALFYAKNYDTIVIEDLDVSSMTKSAKGTKEKPGRNVAAKSGLNKSILQQGWGDFVSKLCYKAAERGANVFAVSPKYTSQTCSVCGHVDPHNRDGKSFCCTNCGHSSDADINAARVILQRHECGESTLVGGYLIESGAMEKKKERKRTHAIRAKKKSESDSVAA